MPQIKINEIDQSVFTRVVNDDKVKVLVPCIASFGPVYEPDSEKDSAITFTDVQAFNKVFGYTEPEYNPFPNDVSRTYIKQLIDRGAAVSVIRVNDGDEAIFDTGFIESVTLDGSIKTTAVPAAVKLVANNNNAFEPVPAPVSPKIEPDDWTEEFYTKYYKKDDKGTYSLFEPKLEKEIATQMPGTFPTGYYKYEDGKYVPLPSDFHDYAPNTYYRAPEFSKYANNCYTLKNPENYQFCEQITGLTAKYTGSFGNHLLVTFTPVNSINANFANQYSIVTVYNADIKVDGNNQAVYSLEDSQNAPADWPTGYYIRSGEAPAYIYSPVPIDTTYAQSQFYKKSIKLIVNKTITGVHKLEQHMVTTNPNDVNYIETVNEEYFQYIKFSFKPSARDEFTVAWSNIGNTTDGTVVLNGFPNVPLRYTSANGISTYNTDALMDNGYDFNFSDDLKQTLVTGYQTIDTGAAGQTKLTVGTVNDYVKECYLLNDGTTSAPISPAIPSIVTNIIDAITHCYKNYSDPYIYDFDFITAGGFINEEFIVKQFRKVDNDYVWVTITSSHEIETPSIDTDGTQLGILSSTSNRFDEIIPSDVVSIHAGMLELVRSRKDCIALADVNPGWNPNELPQYVEYLNESQCAVHSPWCYTADPFNSNALTLMPPSFVFLYTLLSNLINSPDSQKWFPPAGVTRATARIVVKPYYEIGSVLLNKWQNDTLSRVNPIMRLKNYGYVIYGQYTSYVAIDQFTHSALESLNVRLVANCVKKQIFNLCLKLAFEPNNSSLWFKFYDGMDKYLLFMKRNDGVYDYRIQMDESTVTTDDINELRCPGKVWINPTRTAEFFDIDFILTEAGVTFNEEGE